MNRLIRNTRSAAPGARRERGVTMLEVLIALVILSIGLLGLAGLQTISLQLNQAAVTRSQASQLAYDITERMRANRPAAADYQIGLADAPPGAGSVAATDVTEWRALLAASLPEGTGSIAVDAGTGRVTIVIQWADTDDAADSGAFERDTATSFEFRTQL
ncbi:MAG: type IV pilus modification protein PilV [Gammaproteobacteria bacterium]|nr:type IV pilus modification protein PilV [Gammaproteobacteria bacterium]